MSINRNIILRGETMSKLFFLFGILICYLLFFSCTEPTKDDDTIETKWITVFFDDFNRTNTINGDLGSNWIIKNTNASVMQIFNCEVIAEQDSINESRNEPCPCAVYFQDVNYNNMRVSIRARTDAVTIRPTFLLVANGDTNLNNGYTIGYTGDLKIMESPCISTYDSYELSPNTTYIIEIVTDSTGFEATMIDSTTGITIIGGHIWERSENKKVGFIAGGITPSAIYVDDFKIEIPE